MRYLRHFLALVLIAMLVACGGGGGSAGTTGTTTPTTGTTTPTTGTTTTTATVTSTTTTATVTVASFVYQLDKPLINNSGGDKALLTVTALDASNNPVSGAGLSVAVDTGIYTPVTATTDATGQATGNITVGSNKANRNITANIRLGGRTTTAVVSVSGSQITMTPVPATPAPGASMRVDIKVADSNGVGIPSAPVQLSGTLGLSGNLTTDSGGNASVALGAAPAAAGTYSIDAAALGTQATRSVQVVSSVGSGIPAAVGTISAASLAIVPNTISPNAGGSTANRAGLEAVFLNASNQAIQNVRVRFEIVPPGLGSGEKLSTETATVYSDVNGRAIADYIAGSRSSPTNGVTIRACYGNTDAEIASDACPNSVTKTLTVASQPLAITLGDNHLLERGNNSLTYIKKFDVAVADAAGNAVANALVSASVDITHYGKGGYSYRATRNTTTVTGSGTATVTEFSIYQVPFGGVPSLSTSVTSTMTTVPTLSTGRVWCVNEDINRNGFLDTGEDVSLNGRLEPRKADVILSFLGPNVTGANGRMTIQVEYPQNVATWLAYTVKVTTSVAGSEGTDQKSYVPGFIEGDDENGGSFLNAPYGTNPCNNPN